MKYHVSPDGPRRCKAENGGCPYEQAGKPHFDNQEEAQQHYEQTMNEHFGVIPKMKKSEKARQNIYSKADAVETKINDTKASVRKFKEDSISKLKDFTTKTSSTTKEQSRRIADYSVDRSHVAKQKVNEYSEQAKPYVKASARTTVRIAKMIGKDISVGAKKVNSRYKISERVKAAWLKVSTPVKQYTKSRAEMISRIVREEMPQSDRDKQSEEKLHSYSYKTNFHDPRYFNYIRLNDTKKDYAPGA